jgi:hypothetical protein
MSAWTVIAHTELPSAQAWIEFASIPQTYDDLVILWTARNSSNEGQGRIKINNSTSNFTVRFLRGDGSSASSFSDTVGFPAHIVESGATASTFANIQLYIPNYRAATAKSISVDGVTETNATTTYLSISAMLWNVTDAITKIELGSAANNLVQYSSATLYGITKGSSGGVSVS